MKLFKLEMNLFTSGLDQKILYKASKGFLESSREFRNCAYPLAHMFIRSSKNIARCLQRQSRFISPRAQSFQLHYSRPVYNSRDTPFPPTDSQETPEEPPARSDEESSDSPPKRNLPITYQKWPPAGSEFPLGVKVLDEAGEVFVLSKEEIQFGGSGGPLVDDTAATKWDQRSLLKQLDDENEEASDASFVKKNLEGIRSTRKPHDALLMPEWDALRTAIGKGFFSAQLSDYILNFEHEPVETDPAWQPGISLFSSYKAGDKLVNRFPSLRGSTSKRLLIEEIMRNCWQLEIQGETGQLNIPLPSRDISMLLNAKYGPLGDLARENGVKIDVSHSLGLVILTGNRQLCERIQKPIEDFVSRVHSDTLKTFPSNSSSGVDAYVYDDNFLAWLGDHYGVACTRRGKGKIEMAYLSENAREAEEARRSLALRSGLSLRSLGPFCAYDSTREEADLCPVTTSDSLSFVDRPKEWFRWSKQELADQSLPEASDKEVDHGRNELKRFLLDNRNTIHKRSSKDDRLSESITATVGKYLFSKQPTLNTGSINVDRLRGVEASQRIFVNDVPDAHSFVHGLQTVGGDTAQTLYRIRLVPSPFSKHRPPPVELELAIPMLDSSARPSIRRASAILSEETTDCLIPQTTQDLRFTRKLIYDLMPARSLSDQNGNDATKSSLLECVEDLRYTLPLTQTQPAVPPFCRLSLPKRLLTQAKGGGSVRGKGAASDTEVAEVEYMFPPLKSILGSRVEVLDYQGLNLSFSHSFTGPILANENKDLSLAMEETSGTSEDSFNDVFDPFYRKACALAFDIGSRHGKGDI
ncbi:hypothetical protein FQN54_003646 [Arachnomyces sp. PD_36]|nr:hypothetical protein FQN54_003646 [Arachnomyces sp. PD_36]